MNRPRGFLLMYGLALLGVVIGGMAILAQVVSSRAHTTRDIEQRESATKSAEDALEQARSELTAGALKPGATSVVNGFAVTCAATPAGARLDVLVPYVAPAKKLTGPRKYVHVLWNFTSSGSAWRLDGRESRSETQAP